MSIDVNRGTSVGPAGFWIPAAKRHPLRANIFYLPPHFSHNRPKHLSKQRERKVFQNERNS